MRNLILVPTLVIATVAPTARLAAQTPGNARNTNARNTIELPAELFKADQPAVRQARPWYSRLLSAVGGAALGAGMGFFASQVFTGDWEERPGMEVDRPTWAAVGGSIGFAVGLSFPIGGRGVEPQPSLGPGIRGGRFTIRGEELEGTGVAHAYEAVRLLRPEWLIGRGPHVLGESPDETIDVYLDDVRLGGVRFLRDIPAQTIASIHFLDAAGATFRWGAGHSHGVILVIARGGKSGT